MDREKKKLAIIKAFNLILGKTPYFLECMISVIMLLVIFAEMVFLIQNIGNEALDITKSVNLSSLMDNILWLVIGLEFVRMLLEHSHMAVLEIMLFTIARQMIVAHTSMIENLFAVAAIAGIFAIRKYLYSKE